MRLSVLFVGLVGALSGTAVAVTGYQHVAAVPEVGPASTTALPAVGRPLPAAPPRIRVRVLPCHRPARLEHGACVTRVTRTVVVYDPAPAPVRSSVQAPTRRVGARAPAQPSREHDDGHRSRDGYEPGDD